MHKRFIKTHFFKAILLILVVFVVFLLVCGISFFSHQVATNASVDGEADRIIALCKNESYRPTCYDREIPKLMKRFSLEDAFIVARIVQQKDSAYPYCHVLGHELGGIETAKDPSAWKNIAARCPTDSCSNGCMHGVFQERFRKEDMASSSVDEISTLLGGICEKRDGWNATSLEQATCSHALGHLTMYITRADIVKSLVICDQVTIHNDENDFRPLCYDGVFMQLFQPLEPDDFALVEGKVPTKEKMTEFCAPYKGEQKNSCWSESWPLSIESLRASPENAVKFCAALRDAHGKDACVTDMFYIMAVQLNLDHEKIATYCGAGKMPARGQCFAAAASRLLEIDVRNIDSAVALCTIADAHGAADACYQQLAFYSAYNFGKGSPSFTKLCTMLPTKWQDQCLSGTIHSQ